MGIYIGWDTDDKRVIRYLFEGHWDWNEFSEKLALCTHMVHSVGHSVDIILELGTNSGISNNMSEIWRLLSVCLPSQGHVVMIAGGAFINAMSDLLNNLDYGRASRFKFADDLQSARGVLDRV